MPNNVHIINRKKRSEGELITPWHHPFGKIFIARCDGNSIASFKELIISLSESEAEYGSQL